LSQPEPGQVDGDTTHVPVAGAADAALTGRVAALMGRGSQTDQRADLAAVLEASPGELPAVGLRAVNSGPNFPPSSGLIFPPSRVLICPGVQGRESLVGVEGPKAPAGWRGGAPPSLSTTFVAFFWRCSVLFS
jgi:hypothetical protein